MTMTTEPRFENVIAAHVLEWIHYEATYTSRRSALELLRTLI